MNIRTNYQYFGWVAVDEDTYDGLESPIGWGSTQAEAIECLQEQIAEREERKMALPVNAKRSSDLAD